jgi:Tol biopolymer transport system component
MATEASQPWWQWGTGALVYRDRLTPGISLLPTAGGTPQLLAFGAAVAWPSLSPDGTRLAYAAQDAGGVWQIYIRPTDGTADATLHTEGKGPVWGRNGWLAWNGCQVRGDCGIIIDNPDDDQPPARLSGGTNDIGLSWSPDGGNLAYMANHTGNWEVYLVSTGGGFAQLTDDPASDGLPAWAPDGSGLAFVSNRDGAWGVYLMGPNGEDPHKILDLGPSLPDWTSQRLSWAP